MAKTGVYIFIGLLLVICISLCSSISMIATGNKIASSSMARIMALFGGPSLAEQAQTICPSLVTKPNDQEAIEYITGNKTCPPVQIQTTPGSVTGSAVTGSVVTGSTISGA